MTSAVPGLQTAEAFGLDPFRTHVARGMRDLFLPLEDYRQEVTRRIEVIKATPRQAGVTEIRIPGERGYKTRARLMRDGIEIDRKIYDALRRLSDGNLNHGG